MQDTKEELIERLRKSDEGSKLAGGTAHSGLTQDNALSHLDTESNSATTVTERTPADSAVSQEVGDVNDPVGVEVAETAAGKEDNLIVMDVLGVSRARTKDRTGRQRARILR
jgi:hypothetical protein